MPDGKKITELIKRIDEIGSKRRKAVSKKEEIKKL